VKASAYLAKATLTLAAPLRTMNNTQDDHRVDRVVDFVP
jgi:hypothetical protein